jgi:hypothetical protein
MQDAAALGELTPLEQAYANLLAKTNVELAAITAAEEKKAAAQAADAEATTAATSASSGYAGALATLAIIVAGVGIASVDEAAKIETSQARIANALQQTLAQAQAVGEGLDHSFGIGINSSNALLASLAPNIGMLQQVSGAANLNTASQQLMAAAQGLSATTGEKLDETTKAIVETLRTFHLSAADSVTVADALAEAEVKTGQNAQTVAQAFGFLHSELGALNPTLGDVQQLLIATAQSGSDSSRVLNQMATGFGQLFSQTNTEKEALQHYHIELKDGNGVQLTYSQVLTELAQKLGPMSEAERSVAEEQLLGTQAAKSLHDVLDVLIPMYADGAVKVAGLGRTEQGLNTDSLTLAAGFERVKSAAADALGWLGMQGATVLLALGGGLHAFQEEIGTLIEGLGRLKGDTSMETFGANWKMAGLEGERTAMAMIDALRKSGDQAKSTANDTAQLGPPAYLAAHAYEGLGTSIKDADKAAQLDSEAQAEVIRGHTRTADALKAEAEAYRTGTVEQQKAAENYVTIARALDAQAAAAEVAAKRVITADESQAASVAKLAEGYSALQTARDKLDTEEAGKTQEVTKAVIEADNQRVQSAKDAAEASFAAWKTSLDNLKTAVESGNQEAIKFATDAEAAAKAAYASDANNFHEATTQKIQDVHTLDSEEKAAAAERKKAAEEQKKLADDLKTQAHDREAINDAIDASNKRLADDARTAAETAKSDADAIADAIDSVFKKLAADVKSAAEQAKSDARSIQDAASALKDAQDQLSQDQQAQQSSGPSTGVGSLLSISAAFPSIGAPLPSSNPADNGQIAALQSQIDSEKSIIDAQKAQTQAAQDTTAALQSQLTVRQDLLAASGQTATTDAALLALEVQRDQIVIGGGKTTEIDKQISAEQAKNKLAADTVALQDVGLQKQLAAAKASQDGVVVDKSAADAEQKKLDALNSQKQALESQVQDQKSIAQSSGDTATNTQSTNSSMLGTSAAASILADSTGKTSSNLKTIAGDQKTIEKAQQTLSDAQQKSDKDKQDAQDKYTQDAIDGNKKIVDAREKAAKDADNAEHKFEEDSVSGAQHISDAYDKLAEDIKKYLSDKDTGAFPAVEGAATQAFNNIHVGFGKLTDQLSNDALTAGVNIGANFSLGITTGAQGGFTPDTPGGAVAAGGGIASGVYTFNLILGDLGPVAEAVAEILNGELTSSPAGAAPGGL